LELYYDPYKVYRYGREIREQDVDKFRKVASLYRVVAMIYDGFEHFAMCITSYDNFIRHVELMESGNCRDVRYYRIQVRQQRFFIGQQKVIGPMPE
jgi:hypothetical protein